LSTLSYKLSVDILRESARKNTSPTDYRRIKLAEERRNASAEISEKEIVSADRLRRY
jgi:hypothetical protein